MILASAAGLASSPLGQASPAISTGMSTATVPKEFASPEALERFMAIAVPAGEQAQFVVGDNLAGYFESWTHCFRCGGYRVGDEHWFDGYASRIDGVLLDRERAPANERIFPWGHRVDYSGASESLMLHSGMTALSLRVDSEKAARLTLEPLWSFRISDYHLSKLDDGILLDPREPGKPAIALVSDTPFAATAYPPGAPGERVGDVRLMDGPENLRLRLESREPVRRFTLHLVYGKTAESARTQARSLLTGNAWERNRRRYFDNLTGSWLWTSDRVYDKALLWAKASASSLLVRQFGPGIWAGLPWFRDNWGRDTFIALPGTLLVNGRFELARAVLDNFSRYQKRGDRRDPEYGRIPNRVAANTPVIYNTVDGTPWMIREALEYLRYSGDKAYARRLMPRVQAYIDGVENHWLDPDGLLTHDDADTWMDARIADQEAWSPRGNRAVEIQALWYTSLLAGAELARLNGDAALARRYEGQADSLKTKVLDAYWDGQVMADHLRADGRADRRQRPNVLMLISVPFGNFIPEPIQAEILRASVNQLLYPYGIVSLDPADRYFHPRHENPGFYHKDAAYHNGTIWGWNAGFTITALNKFGETGIAYRLSQNLSKQILTLGTRGSMSELLDALPTADGRPHPSGTFVQAWSVAEFVRNGFQDYLGFRPDLIAGELRFQPALPEDWRWLDARLPYGRNEALFIHVEKNDEGKTRWILAKEAGMTRPVVVDFLTREQARRRIRFELGDVPRVLDWDGEEARLDGKPLESVMVMDSQKQKLGTLRFATPSPYQSRNFPVLQGKDVLKNAILRNRVSP